jgi:hypothetical protein
MRSLSLIQKTLVSPSLVTAFKLPVSEPGCPRQLDDPMTESLIWLEDHV